jgi:hypothetical protein
MAGWQPAPVAQVVGPRDVGFPIRRGLIGGGDQIVKEQSMSGQPLKLEAGGVFLRRIRGDHRSSRRSEIQDQEMDHAYFFQEIKGGGSRKLVLHETAGI